jgi:exoribonuclease-2
MVQFDLVAAARRELLDRGFEPDFPADVRAEAAALPAAPPAGGAGLQDLRHLAWSSIDNDESRDLDQVEVAEAVPGGTRVLVGVADVDADVARASAIDRHAAKETTTVYTGVRVFPMLPERLSTDLTSLVEGRDRLAIVIEFTVAPDGALTPGPVRRALVRNQAQLAYSAVGPWLEGTAPPPPKLAASPALQAQLKLQDAAAQMLCEARHRLGALSFDRVEVEADVADGQVRGIRARKSNRAAQLIEDFMIAANEVMARTLSDAGVSSIRRVVKAPERWPRIVELAARFGERLPPEPDSGALETFLLRRRAADPLHDPDLSLSVLKLMGSGEYALLRGGGESPGHFGLAAHDYTHSTAPNRRFADLVTQRLIKALAAGAPPPYSDGDLDAIAHNCTLKEDAARKVQRDMNKRIAAVALHDRIGETFSAVVTGVVPRKGVFVRVLDPPVEGRLMRGEHGLDVGDRIRVELLGTDPERGFIDFGRHA